MTTISIVRKLRASPDHDSNDDFAHACEELDTLQKNDNYNDESAAKPSEEPKWLVQAEKIMKEGAITLKEKITIPTDLDVYNGSDLKNDGGGGKKVNRADYTLEETIKLAKKEGYNVIISCEKNNEGGCYYLKGKNYTHEQCKEELENYKPISGTKRGYKQRVAYLLK
jgi:hypothetical protein